MKHNTTFCILVLFIMVLVPVSGCGTSNNAIVFPDSYVEDAIRLTLNQPEGAISQEKLAKLTKLDLSG